MNNKHSSQIHLQFHFYALWGEIKICWLYPLKKIKVYPHSKKRVFWMWYSTVHDGKSISGDLRSVKYPFYCHFSQVHSKLWGWGYNIFRSKTRDRVKKRIDTQLHKNLNMTVQWTWFPNLKALNNPYQVDMLLKSINHPIYFKIVPKSHYFLLESIYDNIYIYIYMTIHTRPHTRACTHTHTHTYIYIYIYIFSSTDCLVVSQHFSMARPFKLGSKPA